MSKQDQKRSVEVLPFFKWLIALAALAGLQYLGDWLVQISGWPVHGSVVGMVLLLAALIIHGGVPTGLDLLANQLLRHLMLFLIPSVAAVSLYFGLVKQHALVFVLVALFATALTVVVTAWVLQRMLRERSA